MKTKFYKLMAFLLSLCLIASFAGCGEAAETTSESSEDPAGMLVDFEDETASVTQDDNSGTTSGGNASGGDTAVSVSGGATVEKPVDVSGSDPFASVPKRLKGTTVTFAHFGDEGADEYQKVFKAFTKKTGIKVKLVSFNQGEYVSQVAKQINGGAAPDVIISNDVFPQSIEIAQPIQNIINLNDSFWDKNIIEATTVGKNTYFTNSLESVWQNIDYVFYNKKIFTDAGITTPSAHFEKGTWTYENLKQCLVDVTATGNMGGYVDADTMAAALGSPVIGYDAKTKTFKSGLNGAVSAYQFTANIFNEGLWSSTAWWGTFSSGNIGVYMSGLYGAKYNGFFKDANSSDLAAAPMPTSYQGKATTPTGQIRGYGIAKGAKNPEGAAYFLRYFLDYEYYTPAGANTFMNKSLEKVYFEQVVPEVQKKGIVYRLESAALIYSTGSDTQLSAAEKATAGQVQSELDKQKNIIDNAVKKVNEKINSYK